MEGEGTGEYEKGGADEVHLGKSDSEVSSQRGCVCDEACGRGEKSRELLGGVPKEEVPVWVPVIEGAAHLCFRRWQSGRAKPNPGQSSSAATLGFPRAVSSASPLSEASDHWRPGEASRPEALRLASVERIEAA